MNTPRLQVARRFQIAAIALAAAALLPSAPQAAFLRSDEDPPPTVPAAPAPVRPTPPRPVNPVMALVRRVEVGAPYHYRGLTVFPLLDPSGPGAPDIRTLDEALRRGWLSVHEDPDAAVARVLARNASGHRILLAAGEIILGGKQNRMVRDDVLLPPDSGNVPVAVYCGERERWSEGPTGFKGAPSMAHPGLRRGATRGDSQDAIWREIEAQSGRAKINSPTRDYHRIYEDPAVRRELDRCVDELRHVPRRAVVGAVAVSGHRILGCDLFSDPDLFARLWEKLLRSYALDALYGHAQRPGALAPPDVRAFLDRAMWARYTERPTPGIGRLLHIDDRAEGAALVWDGRVVHAALFGGTRPHLPPPQPIPLPGPIYREKGADPE